MIDYSEIQKQFNEIIKYSQFIQNPQTDKIFETWLKNKSQIIKAFGDKLIYEYPEQVRFSYSPEEKQRKIQEFIKTVRTCTNNIPLCSFLIINEEYFFENKVEKEYCILQKNIVIPKGMKIIKSFKYFIDDKNLLEEIQNRASRLIQEDKIEGTFCLSVHPLDFLSSSENNANWHSCHSLDGEFRAGNLSYMLDSSTFMAYLKSNKDERLYNFPKEILWNSKKWRMFLHLNENWSALAANKQYPFSLDKMRDFIKNKALPQTNLPNFSHKSWNNHLITSVVVNDEVRPIKPSIYFNEELIPLRELVKNGKNSLQFNDILLSSTYKPYFVMLDQKPSPFVIGEEVPCLDCGQTPIIESELFCCLDCAYKNKELQMNNGVFETCDYCGHPFYSNEGIWVGEDYICSRCADNYTEICEGCNERHYLVDLKQQEDGTYYCQECLSNNFESLDDFY